MKCPHCGQEHPDNFKFCPNTAKAIETQLKACTNKSCPDCGKFILPMDSRFCPTCGLSIAASTDPSEVLLSFFDIVLGETNIYDVDAVEYTKGNGLFGDVIMVDTIMHENQVHLAARQSDRRIFSVTISNDDNLNFPDSWKSMGISPCNVMLSMEKTLGKSDFAWTELRNADETIGIADKRISDDLYICVAVFEDVVEIMRISEEVKNELMKILKKAVEIANEKSETTIEQNTSSDNHNKVNGRYRWQTDSFLKKIEEDKNAREQREREKKLRREAEEREAMIEKWRRKHGK